MYDDRQLFPGGFPGGGFPGGGPPSSPPPGGQQGGNQQPPGPPPNFTPQMTSMQGGPGAPSTYSIDPGGIRRCMFRYTYIWLRRDAFWFYPVFVGRQSVAGWRWIGWRWVYFGIDLDKIRSFTCV
ncbi:hypothetical protein LCM10_16340 [Rossellomorea aquimaris]|uniref:hypothetical protein n=1 Tax=Rossellomorea aquimaris TaxID=189382 RepID=UPI001CD5B7E7|nr:hypothetical protein [Rossellomorea aquimaris]MCA1056570.1 hypothetical protein [Rossellomorea aquimaris]